jgi:hypothetical protein
LDHKKEMDGLVSTENGAHFCQTGAALGRVQWSETSTIAHAKWTKKLSYFKG